MAQIHGSLRFGHFYDRCKSCYELLRAIYGLLRIIPSYYDVFTAKFHDLLRVVTDNYEQLTGILRTFYGLLRVGNQNTQEVKNERFFYVYKTKHCANFQHALPLT